MIFCLFSGGSHSHNPPPSVPFLIPRKFNKNLCIKYLQGRRGRGLWPMWLKVKFFLPRRPVMQNSNPVRDLNFVYDIEGQI